MPETFHLLFLHLLVCLQAGEPEKELDGIWELRSWSLNKVAMTTPPQIFVFTEDFILNFPETKNGSPNVHEITARKRHEEKIYILSRLTRSHRDEQTLERDKWTIVRLDAEKESRLSINIEYSFDKKSDQKRGVLEMELQLVRQPDAIDRWRKVALAQRLVVPPEAEERIKKLLPKIGEPSVATKPPTTP